MDQDGMDEGTQTIAPQSLITEKNVKAALASDKGEKAILKSWTVKDFTSRGDNYACFVTSVQVTFSIDGKDSDVSYIVKLNPCRKLAGFQGIAKIFFIKELDFYSKVIPSLNSVLDNIDHNRLRAPSFYYGCPTAGAEMIFMEDLRKRGFRLFDRTKGMDLNHLSLVLKELGRLHAASVLLLDKYKSHNDFLEEYKYLEDDLLTCDEDGGPAVRAVIEQSLSTSTALLESVAGYEKAISWLETLRSQLDDIFGKFKMSHRCNVICHGDNWTNNMVFRYSESGTPEELMLLDFQIWRYASPATDLNYLLYTSVEGHVRKPNLDALLSIYYDSFKETLTPGGLDMPFTLEELKEEFRAQNRFGGVMVVMVVPMILMESGNVPDLAAMETTENLTELWKNSIEILKGNTSLLQPRFLAMFDEFIEVGTIS